MHTKSSDVNPRPALFGRCYAPRVSSDRPETPPPAGDEYDVHALLSAVLDQPPPDDMADRVVNRLALVETVVELARLFGLAPVSLASDAVRPDDEDDDADE